MEITNPGFFSPQSGDNRLRPLSESPLDTRNDDWGESSPMRSAASTQGSPWRSRSGKGALKLGASRSAPLLPAANSTQASTWYTDHSKRSCSSQGPTMWSSLGSTWRERSQDDFGLPVRKNPDECNAYASGCVPNWSKMNIRKMRALEHELTWTYYRMRRHSMHPERKNVGDPHMPPECVVEKMRAGEKNQFNFWRDLRPPFHINSISRDTESPVHHPDGDCFWVSYACGIDYCGERLWNEKSEAGTFNNMIYGTATIRIPDSYPSAGGLTMVSWGRPSLNWTPKEEFDAEGIPRQTFIDPDKWMPISEELQTRADLPRFAACREATRKANSRRPVEMEPLQSLLLGPHASLPKLAETTNKKDDIAAAKAGVGWEGSSPSSAKKKRQHRIFTSAAGFVRYAG